MYMYKPFFSIPSTLSSVPGPSEARLGSDRKQCALLSKILHKYNKIFS